MKVWVDYTTQCRPVIESLVLIDSMRAQRPTPRTVGAKECIDIDSKSLDCLIIQHLITSTRLALMGQPVFAKDRSTYHIRFYR